MDEKKTTFKKDTFSLNLEYGNILLLISFFDDFHVDSSFKELLKKSIQENSIFDEHQKVISLDVPYDLIDQVLKFVSLIRKTDVIDNELYLILINRLETHFLRVEDQQKTNKMNLY